MLSGFLAVCGMALRTFFRDRGALFWGVAFPIMLMALLGSVFGSDDEIQLRTSLVSPASHPLNDGMRDALASISVVTLIEEEDAEAALAALRRGERSLVVILPDENELQALTSLLLGGAPDAAALPVPIRVFYNEGQSQVAQAGIAIVQQVVAEANRMLLNQLEPLSVVAAPVTANNLTLFDFLVPGMLAMVVSQTGLMGVTWVVADYRKNKVLKRVLATPFPPFVFLAGLVARFTLSNLIQGALVVLIGVVAFGATVVGSYWNLLVLAILGSVTFLAMGFAVATVTKTAEAANNLGSAIFFPMLFLSGTFWPREMIPESLHWLTDRLPLAHLADAMRGVALQADSLADHLGGILYLLLWLAVAVGIAAWRFRWE